MKFRARLVSNKYFSDKWIVGAESVLTSNVRDHAHTDQCVQAICLSTECAKADGQGPSSYAPIAQALHTLPEDERKSFNRNLTILIL